MKLGFQRSENDLCLYTKCSENSKIYVLLYVDDLIVASTNGEEEFKKNLEKRFAMKDLGPIKSFLGIEITRNRSAKTLKLCQKKYIESLLNRFGLASCKGAATPMEAKTKIQKNFETDQMLVDEPYRQLVGCLIYLTNTRPDITYAVNYFSRYQDHPTKETWLGLKRILRYLKQTIDYCLYYTCNNEDDANKVLCGFSDADFGSDPNDRKSISGYVFKLFGNAISWASKKQPTVAQSSTESEYIALHYAVCEALWLKKMIADLNISVKNVTIYEDNQSTIAVCKNAENTNRTKHIDVKYHFIKEKIQNGEILLKYIPSSDEEADIFTKSLGKTLFVKHRESLRCYFSSYFIYKFLYVYCIELYV